MAPPNDRPSTSTNVGHPGTTTPAINYRDDMAKRYPGVIRTGRNPLTRPPSKHVCKMCGQQHMFGFDHGTGPSQPGLDLSGSHVSHCTLCLLSSKQLKFGLCSCGRSFGRDLEQQHSRRSATLSKDLLVSRPTLCHHTRYRD